MSVVVFCGPTIEPAAVRALVPDADVRPPAARGDVLRAMTGRPAAIALIDGYFARVPAVWHKEILWAMSEGIHVFGAASMGALRAAELHTFGMEGVGEIFQAFATGALEDDDEVSVVHGPADSGYRALSDPLVNMRATFAQAANEGVIGVLVARADEDCQVAPLSRARVRSCPAIRVRPARADRCRGAAAGLAAARARGPQA